MEDLYRLAIHDAPYDIWSYVVVLFGLTAYMISIVLRMSKLNKEIQVLEDAADKLPQTQSVKDPNSAAVKKSSKPSSVKGAQNNAARKVV